MVAANLFLGYKKYRVRKCFYSLKQDVDENGLPSSQKVAGTINLVLESSSDEEQILGWLDDRTARKSGRVEIGMTDEEDIRKKIEFKDAVLVSYAESIDSTNNNPLIQELVLSTSELRIFGTWERKL